jgi:hypothetical protein
MTLDDRFVLIRRRARHRNAARRAPLPTCKTCRFPIAPEESEKYLYGRRCNTCGLNRLEDLLRRIVDRRGRRRTWQALRQLAQ